jgi:hypothetical protein
MMVDTNAEEDAWKLVIKSTAAIRAGDQLYNNYGEENSGRLLRDYGFVPVLGGTSSQTDRFWEFTERAYAFRELADGSVATPAEVYRGERGLSVCLSVCLSTPRTKSVSSPLFTLNPSHL